MTVLNEIIKAGGKHGLKGNELFELYNIAIECEDTEIMNLFEQKMMSRYYTGLTEEDLCALYEMAGERGEVKKVLLKGLTEQLLIHLVLVLHYSLTGDYTTNETHWKTEIKAFCKEPFKKKLKGGDKYRLVYQTWFDECEWDKENKFKKIIDDAVEKENKKRSTNEPKLYIAKSTALFKVYHKTLHDIAELVCGKSESKLNNYIDEL